jgi:hypothetical protein
MEASIPRFRLRNKLPTMRNLELRWYPQAGRIAPRNATVRPVRKKPERLLLAEDAGNMCVCVCTDAGSGRPTGLPAAN